MQQKEDASIEKHLNYSAMNNARTPEEQELFGLIDQLYAFNYKLKRVSSDIDSINAREIEAIVDRSEQKNIIRKVLLEILHRMEGCFTRIKELLEKNPNNININKQDPEGRLLLCMQPLDWD